MFVKPGTGFQKLLDKKPLRIAAYGDSKGLMLFRKFICIIFTKIRRNFICYPKTYHILCIIRRMLSP